MTYINTWIGIALLTLTIASLIASVIDLVQQSRSKRCTQGPSVEGPDIYVEPILLQKARRYATRSQCICPGRAWSREITNTVRGIDPRLLPG